MSNGWRCFITLLLGGTGSTGRTGRSRGAGGTTSTGGTGMTGGVFGFFVSVPNWYLEMSVGCVGFWIDGKLSIGEPSSGIFASGSKSWTLGVFIIYQPVCKHIIGNSAWMFGIKQRNRYFLIIRATENGGVGIFTVKTLSRQIFRAFAT